MHRNKDNPLSLAYHSANMLVKIDKDDRIGVYRLDIGVGISMDTLTQFSEKLGELLLGSVRNQVAGSKTFKLDCLEEVKVVTRFS